MGILPQVGLLIEATKRGGCFNGKQKRVHEVFWPVLPDKRRLAVLRANDCAPAGKNKNCYLVFDSDENRDCYYSYGIHGSRDSIDCYRCENVELCSNAVDCTNCYDCAYPVQCDTCTECTLIRNCIGCSNCIMCSNLRQKEYYFKNKAVSREEFKRIRERFSSWAYLSEQLREFEAFQTAFPEKAMHGFQNEGSIGNHLVYCKNAHYCFDSVRLWDAKYCYQMFISAKNCMDCDECGEAELLYDCAVVGYNAYNCRFSLYCLHQISNLTYSAYCFNGSSNLFGCIGLKRRNYCILNKEYSKEEYLSLVEKIEAHMRQTGEWGRFFPAYCSAFAYNRSFAGDLCPLREHEARACGYNCRESNSGNEHETGFLVPDLVQDAPSSITNELLLCEACGKNYKIIPQEFEQHRRNSLALPRTCFSCRHSARLSGRTPRRLWERACEGCSKRIFSAYSPERPERVYCERCYQDSLL